jgi:hypothetical protein
MNSIVVFLKSNTDVYRFHQSWRKYQNKKDFQLYSNRSPTSKSATNCKIVEAMPLQLNHFLNDEEQRKTT